MIVIDVEDQALLDALDGLGDVAEPYIENASEITANRIVLEARARVRRRTGKTQESILVEDSILGLGFAVVSGNTRQRNLPLWIERGTIHQPARPFFEPAVELQRTAHHERIGDAIQQAIRDQRLEGGE